MRILLADHDADFVQLMSYALFRRGFQVSTAYDGAQALRRWRAEDPELMLLDVAMPSPGGIEVCQYVRQQSAVPIILLSGRSEEAAIVRGYEAGADDYIVKPFSHRQLLVRLSALFRRLDRRSGGASERDQIGRLTVGDLVVEPAAFRVEKAGAQVSLTRLEFRVLQRLVRSVDQLVDTRELAEFAWQSPSDGDAGLLKTHVSHIRQKLAAAGGVPIDIRAIPRTGYILTAAEALAPQPPPSRAPVLYGSAAHGGSTGT